MKGVLRLEIEKHQNDHVDLENLSESGSVTNDSIDDRINDSTYGKLPSNGLDGRQGSSSKWNSFDTKEISGNGSNSHGNPVTGPDDVSFKLSYCLLSSSLSVAMGLFFLAEMVFEIGHHCSMSYFISEVFLFFVLFCCICVFC